MWYVGRHSLWAVVTPRLWTGIWGRADVEYIVKTLPHTGAIYKPRIPFLQKILYFCVFWCNQLFDTLFQENKPFFLCVCL